MEFVTIESARAATEKGMGGVIVDNSSLAIASRYFERTESSSQEEWRQTRKTLPRSAAKGSALAALNLIQSLVIYEKLYADGLVLTVTKSASLLAERYSPLITGLRVSVEDRADILPQVALVASNYEALSKTETGLHSALELAFGGDYAEATAGKDVARAKQLPLKARPVDYSEAQLFGNVFERSDDHVARTFYYAVLSEFVGLPYAPHPIRCPLFALIHAKQADSTQQVLETFTRAVTDATPELFRGYDLTVSIPPVAQYIFATVDGPRALYQRIFDVRDSKHARAFRGFCGELQLALRAGLPGRGEAQRLLLELKEASQAWAKDVHEHVDYQTRDIRIALGVDFLKAEGEVGGRVKDRILWGGRYKALLFLNDLLRGWKPRR